MDVFFDWRHDERVALAHLLLSFVIFIVGIMSVMMIWIYIPENILFRYVYAVLVLIVTAVVLHTENVDLFFLWLAVLLFIVGWIIGDILFHEGMLMLITVGVSITVPAISWFYFKKTEGIQRING